MNLLQISELLQIFKIYHFSTSDKRPIPHRISKLCLPIFNLICSKDPQCFKVLEKNTQLQNEFVNFEKIKETSSKIMFASVSARVAN